MLNIYRRKKGFKLEYGQRQVKGYDENGKLQHHLYKNKVSFSEKLPLSQEN